MSASPGGTVAPVEEGPEAGTSAKAPAAARRNLGLDRFAILFVFALLIIGFGIARPRLLLLHEPTQGVDVGARRDIYRFVKSAAALDQMAVLWVTTDFGELAEVCSRVVVVSQGRELATLAGDELSNDAISAAALRQKTEV